MIRGAARVIALVGVLAFLPLAPFDVAPAHAAPPFWPWGSVGGPSEPGTPPFTLPGWPGAPGGTPPNTGGTPPSTGGTPPNTGGTPPNTGGIPPNIGQPTGPGFLNSILFMLNPRVKPPAVTPCRIRSGSRADFVFTAVLREGGRQDRGRSFEFGAVQDLLIEVRWASVDVSARQRLELYAPDGHLYQMITTTLPAHAEPVVDRVPVSGSWISSATLTGTWCAKVYLDDELTPAAADDFELRFPRER